VTTVDTSNDLTCEFCNRVFVRSASFVKHTCERKRRWIDLDTTSSRIGYQVWRNFNSSVNAVRKSLSQLDFIKSPYYSAFSKFGNYCVEVKVINTSRYADWLLKNKVPIDRWASDAQYHIYLTDYLRNEDPFDAIARSVETTIELSQEQEILSKDVLRYGNANKTCYQIAKGNISPWMLYQSESGKEFLDKLDQTQVKMIFDYINPEPWAVRFMRYKSEVIEIRKLLLDGGY
jgi:hypothetical protein